MKVSPFQHFRYDFFRNGYGMLTEFFEDKIPVYLFRELTNFHELSAPEKWTPWICEEIGHQVLLAP